jgi:hypothetical protein
MAMVPCMKSGTAISTASMFFSSLSSIFRKSVYLGAFSKVRKFSAARAASGSHNATMFCCKREKALMPAPACPPAPIEAMFSFSLGDL